MYSFGAGQKIGSLKFEEDILKGPLKDSECNFRIDKPTVRVHFFLAFLLTKKQDFLNTFPTGFFCS